MAAFAACSSDDGPEQREGAENPDPGGNGFQVDDGMLNGVGAGSDESSGTQCQAETREAEAIGLDIYVMLDSSGSMLDLLPGAGRLTPTKWDAVRQSLEAFLQAPDTAQIGVGLQYFPQVVEGVPFSCTTNQECGPLGGACTNSICVGGAGLDVPNDGLPALEFLLPVEGGTRFCLEDADCAGPGQSCRTIVGECIVPAGVLEDAPAGSFLNVSPDPDVILSPVCGAQADCAGLPGTICDPIGICQAQAIACTPTLGCPAGAGACAAFPYGCSQQTRCEAGDYSTPAVPISNAATRATDIIASLAAQTPQGLTPTGPALQGALEHAQLWAQDHPDRQVVTVLATDGFPTECAPLEIPEIAAIAQAANRGQRPVRTFVIGVFGNADLGGDGQQRLDTIARAGGTDQAIVINTAGDVTQDFLDALNLIRDTAVSCEFQLDAAALDFEQVNLELVDEGGSTALFNVGDPTACGSDEQGWYYERDERGTPTQITVCPSTCRSFNAGGARVNLQIGCATRLR